MTEASACRWSVYVVRSTGARECVDDRLTAGEAKSAADPTLKARWEAAQPSTPPAYSINAGRDEVVS